MSSVAITRRHLGEMFRFAMVGGSGVFVNLAVYVGMHKIVPVASDAVFLPLPPSAFNIRWLHVFATCAFLVANLWNFELNRVWTFRHGERASRTRFGRFFAIGVLTWAIGLLILTALTNPTSPVALPTSIFDNSSGFRTQSYWAQVISIALTTPISFLLNRFWTFAGRGGAVVPLPPEAPERNAAA